MNRRAEEAAAVAAHMNKSVGCERMDTTIDHRPQRSYDQWDPVSLRRLIDAVEAKAKRMRAEAIRDLLRLVRRVIYRTFSAAGRMVREIARRAMQRTTSTIRREAT